MRFDLDSLSTAPPMLINIFLLLVLATLAIAGAVGMRHPGEPKAFQGAAVGVSLMCALILLFSNLPVN